MNCEITFIVRCTAFCSVLQVMKWAKKISFFVTKPIFNLKVAWSQLNILSECFKKVSKTIRWQAVSKIQNCNCLLIKRRSSNVDTQVAEIKISEDVQIRQF